MITLKVSLKKMVDPNKDEEELEIAKLSEVGNKHKSRIPKNHPILNVIGNIDDSMVIGRQSRQNEIRFVFYIS